MPLNPFDYVGKAVQKRFRNYGVYRGRVLELVSVRGTLYFRVEYEDGDMEDVPLQELGNILLSANEALPGEPLAKALRAPSPLQHSSEEAEAAVERDSLCPSPHDKHHHRNPVLVAGEPGTEDVAAPAGDQTFQQEQLHSVGIQEILNVMHKYTHESAKSSSRLLLLEAVGTFTFMMDDVNSGKTPGMLKRLEGGGSACSKGHAVSEENGESAAQGPTRESPAAAPIPTVLNKVGAGSRRRIRNREWVGDSMKVQKSCEEDYKESILSDSSGTLARRSRRIRVPPKRFRHEEHEADAQMIDNSPPTPPHHLSSHTPRFMNDEGFLDFMDNSDEEPPASAPEPPQPQSSVRSGPFSLTPARKSKFSPTVEKVWTLCGSSGLQIVPIMRPSGHESWSTDFTVQKRVPKSRSLREILSSGPKQEFAVGWINGAMDGLPCTVKRLRVSPGSSDSTSEAMEVMEDGPGMPLAPSTLDQDWELRPGVCNPNKLMNREPEITFVIRDLVSANLVHLGDKVQFRWVRGEVLAEGWLTRVGILCNRCGGVVSCTEFAKCAGRRVQNPSAHIYVVSHGESETWMSLHDLEITLYSMSSVADLTMKPVRQPMIRARADGANEHNTAGGAYDITLDMLFN